MTMNDTYLKASLPVNGAVHAIPAAVPQDSLAEKTLAEFSARQAAMTSMRERFTGLSCATPAQYEETRIAIAELRGFRVEVERRRKELNADAQTWIKNVNGESKRLIEEAEKIEVPLKAMKDAVDEEKERKKAELQAAQAERIRLAEKKKLEEDAARVKAEQEAAAEKLRVENEKLAAERERIRAENERLRQEREELARQQRELFEAQEAERRKKEAEEKAKRDAAERAEAERIAKERADEEFARQQREMFEAQQAEAARLERIKPDVQRVREFGAKVTALVGQIPEVSSEDAGKYMQAARELLERMAWKMGTFGA
jgi:chromosome segregation ATPase